MTTANDNVATVFISVERERQNRSFKDKSGLTDHDELQNTVPGCFVGHCRSYILADFCSSRGHALTAEIDVICHSFSAISISGFDAVFGLFGRCCSRLQDTLDKLAVIANSDLLLQELCSHLPHFWIITTFGLCGGHVLIFGWGTVFV